MSVDVALSSMAVAAVGLFTLAVGFRPAGERRVIRFHATPKRGWSSSWAPAIAWAQTVLIALLILLAGWSGTVVLFASGK